MQTVEVFLLENNLIDRKHYVISGNTVLISPRYKWSTAVFKYVVHIGFI